MEGFFLKKTKSMKFKYILLLLVFIALIVNYLYRKAKFVNGELAPDFTVTLIDNRTISLSQFKGKYVLLDFWGSWCGPCRAENPSLVALVRKYQNSKFINALGFEIISIAIETNRSQWTTAIANDQLFWEHYVTSLKRFSDPVATLYGVRQIPTKFLISPEGIIVGVDLTVEEIDKRLTEKLAK